MKYKFDQIAVNSTSKKKPVETDKEHYIGLEHLDSNCFTVSRWGADAAPVGEKLIMKKGDILFGKRRAYQRKVAIAPFDGIFSAHGMVLRPKTDVIDPDYFPFFLSSDYFMETAIRISVGGLSPTINWKDLKEQEFNLPSLEEQKVLANKLWAAYRLKEAYQRLLNTTDEMVKSQFLEMTKDVVDTVKLSRLVQDDIAVAKRNYSEGDIINYIDISSIDSVGKRFSVTTQYEFAKAPSRAQQCIEKGDILYSTVRPNLRNYGIVNSDAPNLVASSGFCVLRPKDGYYEYVFAIISSDTFTAKMVDKAQGGVFPAVNQTFVLDQDVPLPDKRVIQHLSEIVRQADKSKFELRKAISAIDEVIKSLING